MVKDSKNISNCVRNGKYQDMGECGLGKKGTGCEYHGTCELRANKKITPQYQCTQPFC